MVAQRIAAFSILALTVSLSLARPRLRGVRVEHALAAGLGALLTLALGVVPLALVAQAVTLLLLPALTVVSLTVITLVAERAKLFDLLSGWMAGAARGSGRRLFALVFSCGAACGTIFTNDAAVLIFTPLVFQLVEQVGGQDWTARNRIPYYFAVLSVANLVGALVISNPIHLIAASLLGISFLEYAGWMLLPAAAGALATYAGIRLLFRKDIPVSFDRAPPRVVLPADRRLLRASAAVLAATLVGFFAEGITGVPTWLVASCGAAALLWLHVSLGGGDARSVLVGVSWDALAFMVGIFVVVLGLRHGGLTVQVGRLLAALGSEGSWSQLLGTSLLAAGASAVANNHPTADLMAWAIRDLSASPRETRALAFAALIGGDLGPKMLPIGSLAALIWFRLLRARGVRIPYGLYVKIGVPVTLAALLAAVAVLDAELWLAALLAPERPLTLP